MVQIILPEVKEVESVTDRALASKTILSIISLSQEKRQACITAGVIEWSLEVIGSTTTTATSIHQWNECFGSDSGWAGLLKGRCPGRCNDGRSHLRDLKWIIEDPTLPSPACRWHL